MIDESKFAEVSDTQLEIGFRTIKTKLDEANKEYREVIFDLPAKGD